MTQRKRVHAKSYNRQRLKEKQRQPIVVLRNWSNATHFVMQMMILFAGTPRPLVWRTSSLTMAIEFFDTHRRVSDNMMETS
ncbi:MAG: hypothetical protein C0486_08325 [Erythrobacter sp.]|nr:hypothetical protein [Erythrobacter sp.]MBA4082735.1 hypothetical protein [Erythrobacter sp.]